ncbi:TPA: dTDP-6-deoxy-3,4-keto-hexulose isomerase, partial [Streptococcus suis]
SPVSSAFMGLDFAMNLQNENVGRAAVHTAVTTVATTVGVGFVTNIAGALAASVATSSVAAGLGLSSYGLAASVYLASNPIGWAIGAGIAIGFVVNVAYNNNFFGIQDMANNLGDQVNEGLEDVGQAISSGWDSLTGAFGW